MLVELTPEAKEFMRKKDLHALTVKMIMSGG